MAKKPAKSAKKPPRRNMRAAERERFIVDEAVKFFAEQGFGGQTRELAKRMGITHSAIYRHFPSKEALIERVYEEIYLSRWSPSWNALIGDRTLSLQTRLSRFYLEYVGQVFEYNWVRIFVFSGLKSFDITKRYLQIVRDQIIEPACCELRHDLKLPSSDEVPLSEREIEMFWGLHGRIFYMAIRRFVYETPTPDQLDDIVNDAVRVFIDGSEKLMRELVDHARR
ncbi:MAG: TetR family transcriptional regulator [Tardiphaga sp.]|jgi:AcrR family transcriptional regulator|uniref:TetR/AcrR family transcriptional regulator n=1 Tax=Tardiphaga sp. TaxID=1926292 RepID=UPI0026027DDD|nr:TetR/AcrR family transcriptional regulator [Tardiphaga sp.]MDB5504061.1 TetR family transcriptional regulator [Tardiphaga sp.]